jgi:hypothetical protein
VNQLGALLVTSALSITSGLLTGWIIKRKCFEMETDLFEDKAFWVIEEEEEEEHHQH